MSTRLDRQLPHPRATLEARYGLMGEHLLVQSDDPAVLAAAADAFGRYAVPRDDMPPLIVRLFVDRERRPSRRSSGGRAPRTAPGTPGTPASIAPRYLADGHLFLIDLADHGAAVADQRAGIATGRVSETITADVPHLRYTVVEAMALSLLASRGYVAVHASCVVRDGVAVMLQAPAGTGKSTLAYAALRRGFGILAEDVVFVRPDRRGGVPAVWGAPWRLHLLPDAPALFPELAGVDSARQLNGEVKLEVDVAGRYPAAMATSATAGPQVLLERGPSQGAPIRRLEPLEARDAFQVLWPWGIPWDERYEATATALRDQGVFRLRMSGTPDEAVDLLEQLVRHARSADSPLPSS